MLVDANRSRLFHVLDADAIPGQAAARLAALGITTLTELRDHWTYGNRQLISDFLGESPLRFVSAPPAAVRATRGPRAAGNIVNLQEAHRAGPLVRHARGVLLSAREKRATATAPQSIARATRTRAAGLPAAAPPNVSLIDRFPAIRNQRDRGTCVAFASAAFLEFHFSAQAGAAVKRHSEQFLYWACKQDDGEPDEEGTFVSTARQVLKQRGACLHSKWKYKPLPIAGNEGQGPPPAGARQQALQSRWTKARAVAAKNPVKIRQHLDAGRPVVLSVLTFPSWDFPSVGATGEIPMPFPGDLTDGGHAVCVVGYELNAAVPGGGAFLIRNSWGKSWGSPNNRFQAGYGTLFFEYVKKYGLEAYA
jgi:C1A family cysteine protease